MDNPDYRHIPVLLQEAVSFLQPGPGEIFVDATLGGGGYSRLIAQKTGTDGRLLSIDLDADAVKNAAAEKQKLKINGWTIVHGNFADIDAIVKNHDFPAPHGIVADLGFSSYELDQSGRGMSFKKKEPLDMRFDRSEENTSAAWLINNSPERDLEKIFRQYGEEKFSRQIARRVVQERGRQPLRYTTQLYEAVTEALPKPVRHRADDSARRIFQAVRIAVNHELENLETFLPKAFDLLRPGGRLVVVSFHSLEDRLVKHFFSALSKGCVCPPEFPLCLCGSSPQAKLLCKKPVTASAAELAANPRSKPAKLRAVKKI